MSQDALQDATPVGTLGLESGLEALRSSPDFRGPVEPLEGHDTNDHLALIYETSEEQFAAVVPFVRQGLAAGERCMYVVDESSEAEVLEAMRVGGVDVDAAIESGALTVHSVQETYLRNGTFEPDEMISFYAKAIEEATAEYEALRVSAETSWILEEGTTLEKFMEYESKVNELFHDEDCIALCQYDRTQVPAETLTDIVRTHPHLVYDDTVCHNFYYTPPEEFFGPDRPKREVERMLGTLVDRTRAKAALEEREEYLRRQNDVTADPDRSFEEKLQALFELGCERFDLELGAMARVDPDTDRFEIEYTSAAHEYFEPGFELPLSETYCTAATDRGGVAGVSDPFEGGYADATVHREFGLQSYLGTCVEVAGDTDRTFFFVSSEPREGGFSDDELTFHRLMGQWVKHELERRRREDDQRTLYEIAADTDRTFEEKLRALFDLGRKRFELELGGLARIDPGTDRFEVEVMSGEHDRLRPGARVALSETYCRVLADDGETAGVTEPKASGFEGTVAYDEFGVRAYLGTRIELESDLDRTLFFVSSEPRERPFSEPERTFHRLMGQWVKHELERIQRETRLTALNEMSRELTSAETPEGIADCVVEYARDGFHLPLTAVAYYDEDTGELAAAAQTPRAEDGLPTATLCTPGVGVAWDAFVTKESRFADGDSIETSMPAGVGEVVAIPLANHGALVTASTAPDGFNAGERDFLETIATTVESVLVRTDRKQLLQERERTLKARNETLQRLDRVNSVIRNIDQALVRASSRSEIEAVVCDELAGTGHYELAWIGGYDAVTGDVTAREWAGNETGSLETAADPVGDERTPTARAIATREPRIVNNVLTDPPIEGWQRRALERGYRSVIALPLVHRESLYGVLTVYASQPDVFDELEGAVLEELSDTIAYAMNVVESRRAIVDDSTVELEFDVGGLRTDVTELVERTGGEFEFESVVPGSDGSLRGYFTIRGATVDDVVEAARSLSLSDLTLVTERDASDGPEVLFEATLAADSPLVSVLEHGATPRGLTATPEEARLVVELSARADVRTFVERLRTRHPGAELVAKRERERTATTRQGFGTTLVSELTDRQLEVLKTAYASGYFESPRERTGTEIATTLDISQPTFNTHLRTAHRKLCRLLFEGDASA